MGNVMSPCFQPGSRCSSASKLIFYGGPTRMLTGKHMAGEIMFQSPDQMVCHADSFFIGHPIPILAIDDELLPGQTYFVLPINIFACHVLSASALAALNYSSSSPSKKNVPINFGTCPFDYVKGANGRVLIKVVPEFITRLINGGKDINKDNDENGSGSFLCSTPELKKHYEMLVGSKEQVWSPKLETISEYKVRFSPCRFIEWKQKEREE